MMRWFQKYLYLPILLFCISSPGFVYFVIAQENAAPAIRSDVDYSTIIVKLKERLQGYMAQYNVPGLAIALVDGDKLVWAEGFGYTARDNQTKVTADTLFSLQSVSKTYTATGLLIAVEKGLLKLDDPLKKYYPQFTVNSRFGADETNKITFRHLLSHRSGLTHVAPCSVHFGGRDFDGRRCSYADYLRSISETWLKFPAGERFSYSNLGIDLAGYALELRSGRPFAEFMNDELFRPLGMTFSTFNHKMAASNPSLAKGHIRDRILPGLTTVLFPVPMTALIIPVSGNYLPSPAGGMHSTVKDMAKFISFHLAGGKISGKQIIEENLLKEMYRPQFPSEGQVNGYGLGIESQLLRSGTLLLHAGGGAGYLTSQMWTPEYQVGVVVLTNSESGNPSNIAAEVLLQMIEAKYGPDSQTAPAKLADKPIITVDTKLLQRLAGTYKFSTYQEAFKGYLATFKVKEDGLYLVPETYEVRLNAHGPTEFTKRGFKFIFILDEKGKPRGVQYLYPSASGYSVEFWPFNDNPDEEAGPDKKEWHGLVGEYSRYKINTHGSPNINVMTKNGYLYFKDQGGLKLDEYKPGLFFTPDGEAVVFQGDRMLYGNVPYLKKSTKTPNEQWSR
jgi:CubicO group peptidase (beta-lactamase class C family)